MISFAISLLLLLNLNTATLKELDALPGVGPVLARRIVEFRDKKGGFRRIEELLAIPGVSEKKWQAIKEKVEVK
jgi:competence protein ComEA